MYLLLALWGFYLYSFHLDQILQITAGLHLYLYASLILPPISWQELWCMGVGVQRRVLPAFSFSSWICCLRYSMIWSASAARCSSLNKGLWPDILIKERARNLTDDRRLITITTLENAWRKQVLSSNDTLKWFRWVLYGGGAEVIHSEY